MERRQCNSIGMKNGLQKTYLLILSYEIVSFVFLSLSWETAATEPTFSQRSLGLQYALGNEITF